MENPVKGRILIMGDSISDNGTYAALLNTWLAAQGREDTHFFNIGVSSETVSGLSEPSHPFPRPCGLERLPRALERVRPDHVFIFYGMNDGIYYPPEQGRFARFREGIRAMAEGAERAGCGVILATPTPFDKRSYAAPLYPAGEAQYGYDRAYEDYDRVLEGYARWILEQGPAPLRVDMRTPLEADRAAVYEADPRARTGDGIHPDAHGHWVMARTVISALFGREAGDWGDRVMAHPLWPTVLEGELAEHRLLKETVGHGLPEKAALPTEAEYAACRRAMEEARAHLLGQIPGK